MRDIGDNKNKGWSVVYCLNYIKGFADDLTLVSSDKEDHRNALSRIDLCASDLDLAIRADKCYTLSLKGLKQDKKFSVALVSGKTTPISKADTKFLGRYIACTPKSTTTLYNDSISSKFKEAIEKIDTKHIRGEFKVWIYHHYLAPSFHYFLAVNQTSTTRIQNLEAVATRKMKKWLNLPRNATQVLLYHPEVMKIPQLSTIKLKAKLTNLTAVMKSPTLLHTNYMNY